MTERKQNFTDVDARKEKKELAKQLQTLIRICAELVRNPKNRENILAFNNNLQVTDAAPVGNLPYYNPKAPMSNRPDKVECLQCVLCFLIQTWWKYLREEECADFIKHKMSELKEICELGLTEYSITGDLVKGYRLKKKGV